MSFKFYASYLLNFSLSSLDNHLFAWFAVQKVRGLIALTSCSLEIILVLEISFSFLFLSIYSPYRYFFTFLTDLISDSQNCAITFS